MPKAGAAVTVGNAQRLKATRTPGRCSISGVGAMIRTKDQSCHRMDKNSQVTDRRSARQ